MAILTIARELGAICDGEDLVLCNALNLHCISKATLEERFREMGIASEVLERFDECNPGFTTMFTTSADIYWESLQTILLKELLSDNVAIIGRGGNFLLKNLVDCFRIRLIAPMEYRVNKLCIERNCTKNEALKAIRQSDSNREKFCRFYYSADWRDPLAYDMVINTAEVPLEKLADMLPALIPQSAIGTRKEQLQCAVQEQLIRHRLFSAWNYQAVHLDVKCQPDGTVVLRGCVHSEEASEYAEKIIRDMPGVKAVQNELYVAFMDMVLPMM